MAKKKTDYDPKKLNGMSIYHDEKRTVYSPFFTKKGFIITESNVRDYTIYIQGYLLALLVFCVAYIILKRFTVPLLLAAFFLVSTIVTFYFTFIRKAAVIENYKKPQRDSFAIRQAKSLTYGNILTIIVSCPLLAFFIMLLAYMNHYEGFTYDMMLMISILVICYGLLNIYIFFYKKNHIDKQ